ncbi:DNA oxidative demethylase AlkB [Burkholderia lata]|uniref:DNA-N1-methyladenine dioxygenase n=1 Tax=Burkholderia lata (strain ATCC 17760 / DSM 23089 / LMG 22485 / NCIMB 9086 / R18194 / 383) TaxID=482957 RepID=Q39GA0_BURL3|nr:DNA oxidative demethylase AlkB [Burkholderia lata]ABB08516.1 DNA-N1-methyladenine dioxygenase [Burkholderia lata]
MSTFDKDRYWSVDGREILGENAFILRGFALPGAGDLLEEISSIDARAPFRNMETPGGFRMSVAMTNCGTLGWTTDRSGYRYTVIDPDTAKRWPAMPGLLSALANNAAAVCGFPDFEPDACLINRHLPGARLSLHQDKDERDLNAPIVSVSLGMTAIFLFGGHARGDSAERVLLRHGDVVVWGGVDRMRYHGILPLKDVPHPLLGSQRINLTFRKAG